MIQAGSAIPSPGEKAYDLARLRGFSDGVFAIAITVTVLQLVVPEVDLAEQSVTGELLEQWPLFVSLVIGFVVVGYYWLNHHRVFELMDRADGTVVWLNNLLLLFVVFVPFPTEILGLYHEFTVSWVFFHVIGLAIGLVNAGIWFYATTRSRLVPSTLDARALRVYRWRSTVVPAGFLVAAVVALVSPWSSLACLVLVTAVGRPIVTRIVGTVPAGEDLRETRAQVDEDDESSKRWVGESGRGATSLNWLVLGGSVSSLQRLLAFTDAVYAIAITLLGFQFLPPDPAAQSNDQLREFLFSRELSIDLVVGYLSGFLAIGFIWVAHHRYFTVIRGQDGGLRVLSLTHLFFIALLPNATELLSVHSGTTASIVYYSLIAGMAALTINFLWRWASWRHHLIDADLDHQAIVLTRRLGLVVPFGFLVSVPLAFVIGGWAQWTWLVAIAGLRVFQHLEGSHPRR